MSLVNSPSYTAHLLSVLTDDLIAKQSALDKLQRAVLRAEGTSQLGLWRTQQVEKRNGTLAADLAQLRKLLHEEKTSSKVNPTNSSYFTTPISFFVVISSKLNSTCAVFPSLPFPSLPFPSLPFPSLPFPSLPFPSLPFPSLPFPSLPFPFHSWVVWLQAALSVKGWERLPREEIVTRACQAVAAVAHEKSRNAELVYRLQQTHQEGIEAKQLNSRFAELQVGSILLAPLVAPWLLPN